MYEDQTKDAILDRMLDASPDNIDKRQGSVTWDLLSPAAIEFAQVYIELDNVLRFGFADTTYGEYLDRKAREVGLNPPRKLATKSVGQVTFTGEASTLIPKGTQLSTGGETPVYFETTAAGTISGAGVVTVPAESREGGANTNVAAGAIRLVLGDLAGVVTVTNDSYFEGGTDTETDASVLRRYYEHVQRPATSGNANHYRQWALAVPGVSDAKVYPVWDGVGTVRVVLLDDNKRSPSPVIVDNVRDAIEEQRPIGADVTVEGAPEVPINISVKITLASWSTVEEVRGLIEDGVREYLQSLAFTDPLVRYTRIMAVILDIPPIIDFTDLLVNGVDNTNIEIADGSVAVLGTVDVTEV